MPNPAPMITSFEIACQDFIGQRVDQIFTE